MNFMSNEAVIRKSGMKNVTKTLNKHSLSKAAGQVTRVAFQIWP